MGIWHYGYDATATWVSQTDAKNQTITMAYDALGRLRSKAILMELPYNSYDTGDFSKCDCPGDRPLRDPGV